MYWWYLKNKHTGEICDIIAETLEDARERASEFLGGSSKDYIERF